MPAHPPGHLTSSSSPPWAAQGGTLNFVKSKELQIGIFQKRKPAFLDISAKINPTL